MKLNRDRLISTFVELVKINSPSQHERLLADYLRKRLSEYVDSCREDEAGAKIGGNAGNVLMTASRGKGPVVPLVFVAHMDTIKPTEDLDVIMEKQEIRSSGSTILGADDRAGVAILCEVIETLAADTEWTGTIYFLFTVAEEIGLLGIKNFNGDSVKNSVGYVLDSNQPVGMVVNQAPSSQRLFVTLSGKSAHAGIEPEKGISAIAMASETISKIKLGRINDTTTANIGTIQGGEASNIVPGEVTVCGEVRSFSENELQRQITHMKEAFEHTAKRYHGQCEFHAEPDYATCLVDSEDMVVKLAFEAGKRLGLSPRCVRSCGGSDANVLNASGIPAVVFGVGIKEAHTNREHIAIADLVNCARWVLTIIEVHAEAKKSP